MRARCSIFTSRRRTITMNKNSCQGSPNTIHDSEKNIDFKCQEMKYLLKYSFQSNYYFSKESEWTIKCFIVSFHIVCILLYFNETSKVRKHSICLCFLVYLFVYLFAPIHSLTFPLFVFPSLPHPSTLFFCS